MNITEASLFLLCRPNTVRKLAREGKVKATKNERGEFVFDPDSLTEWKASHDFRRKNRGEKWRQGMTLSKRCWRCCHCLTINLRDRDGKVCRSCKVEMVTLNEKQ